MKIYIVLFCLLIVWSIPISSQAKTEWPSYEFPEAGFRGSFPAPPSAAKVSHDAQFAYYSEGEKVKITVTVYNSMDENKKDLNELFHAQAISGTAYFESGSWVLQE